MAIGMRKSGTVSVWFASVDDGFALERKMPPLPSRTLHQLRMAEKN